MVLIVIHLILKSLHICCARPLNVAVFCVYTYKLNYMFFLVDQVVQFLPSQFIPYNFTSVACVHEIRQWAVCFVYILGLRLHFRIWCMNKVARSNFWLSGTNVELSCVRERECVCVCVCVNQCLCLKWIDINAISFCSS